VDTTPDTKTLADVEQDEIRRRLDEATAAHNEMKDEVLRLRSIVRSSINLFDPADPSVSLYPCLRVTPDQSATIARALLYGGE
jgi:hypothetical protein